MSKKNAKIKFGLVGKNISYSFSKNYFDQKFKKEGISNCSYEIYDLPDISNVKNLFSDNSLAGFNVTIPYKERIINYLDFLSPEASAIGAVNTVLISSSDKKRIGFNTDYYGFERSLFERVKGPINGALILGTGGASKAVAYALTKNKIIYKFVSRLPRTNNQLSYQNLNQEILNSYRLIINTSPLGTHPNVEEYPRLPYEHIGENHIFYDLVYNPAITKFIEIGNHKKALTIGGGKMLMYQADKAWEIWNNNHSESQFRYEKFYRTK